MVCHVGERDLVQLDDVDGVRVPRPPGSPARWASAHACSITASRPPGPGWKIRSTWPLTEAIAAPIAFATSACGGAKQLADTGQPVRDEDAAAADDDQRPVPADELDPVDRVGQEAVRALITPGCAFSMTWIRFRIILPS